MSNTKKQDLLQVLYNSYNPGIENRTTILCDVLNKTPEEIETIIKNGNLLDETDKAYTKLSADERERFDNSAMEYDAHIAILCDFLNKTPEEVTTIVKSNNLMNELDKAYDNLSTEKRELYENGFMASINLIKRQRAFDKLNIQENEPVWAEIRNDHLTNEDGFVIAHIDAWKTGHDDEEGEVIAKVIGTIGADNELLVHVSHQNVDAQVDNDASYIIIETINDVKAELFDLRAASEHITRTRMDDGKVTRLFLANQFGTEDAVVFAQISATRQPNQFEALEEIISTSLPANDGPFVQYYRPGELTDDETNAVNLAVADLKAEFGIN